MRRTFDTKVSGSVIRIPASLAEIEPLLQLSVGRSPHRSRLDEKNQDGAEVPDEDQVVVQEVDEQVVRVDHQVLGFQNFVQANNDQGSRDEEQQRD